MAKKQSNSNTPKKGAQQKTSITNTNTFIKGMNKDTDASYFSKENWFHARNAVNNSVDGDVGVIGNEPANERCAEIPYAIIGGIHLYGDIWCVYSTNNILSEIGLFDDSKCEYTLVVNDICLNFKQDNLIVGAAKENFDCSWQVYWDDGLNPSRTLNLDNVPYDMVEDSPAGATCITYKRAEPLRLDCEKIRLAPLLDVPCITLTKADSGGLLENGSYQAHVAYSIGDRPVTDYIGISNIQPVWSHEDTNGSLDINLSNLDKKFDFITLVIRRRVKGQPIATIIGTYSTESTTINIDFINPELPKIEPSELQRRNPAYEKSDGMYVVNDYLIRTQPTEQFDFNYQPLANEIKTFWTATQYPANYYENGGNKPTLLRDEQYAFFIRFIYNTGERSSSYHIPGRAPNPDFTLPGGNIVSETDLIGGNNSIDPDDRVFKACNTASSLMGDPFIAPMLGTISDDGGTVIDGGEMGYWESTEVYNPTDPARWANLCGMPIRHHKMPDETTGGPGTTLTSQAVGKEGDFINVIGVAFDNITAPLYNDGSVIPNIKGYEILVGSRAGHRSIIGKGIVKNMFNFRKDKDDDYDDGSNGGEGSGLMPNYPFNDLRQDPYLIQRNKGKQESSGIVSAIGQFVGLSSGSVDLESNWLRGNNGGPADGKGLSHISLNNFTFHSPELNFSRLYLNPTEFRLYKSVAGPAKGRFKRSEDHPKNKLLKNRSATIAALIGVGYALKEMRGKRNYQIQTVQSNTAGQFGAYGLGTGSQVDAMPGIGTGTAFVNVAATLPSVWTGFIADTVFNTFVDVAAILGGGKAARQIGTPIYQSVETVSAGLAAGHVGPKRVLEFEGTDFTSVPTIMSIAIGIISFLNYTAIGGDKIITLILNLMSYQDHAYKYISHGYYKHEIPLVSGIGRWRQGVEKARYIKQAIQSFDGNDVVQNVLRPSTVVVRSKINWGDSFPIGDNTKFTIGAGPCAGEQKDQMSWWDPGQEVRSTAVANYAALKTPMDNQYGQLDQIIQLNTQGCYNFIEQQLIDADGDLIPISPFDSFSTETIYAGDSYIARYTEKTIMPFFYNFLKEGPDGIAFNYSKYANVPFPRYWMNTEKFRMDEFIRPITNLKFNWNSSKEALPAAYYNMDTPENGGYCGSILTPIFGEGALAGSTLQDGTSGANQFGGFDDGTNLGGSSTGTTSVGGGPMFEDPNAVENQPGPGQLVPQPMNSRFQVFNMGATIASAAGASSTNVTFTLDLGSTQAKYNVTGPMVASTIAHQNATLFGTSDVTLEPFANFTVDHQYNTPLKTATNVTVNGLLELQYPNKWINFLTGKYNTAVPNMYNGNGKILSFKVIFDWSSGTIVGPTSNPLGFYAYDAMDGATPALTTDTSVIQFQSSTDQQSWQNSPLGFPPIISYVLPNATFSTNMTSADGNVLSDADEVLAGGGPGNPDALVENLNEGFESSGYSSANSEDKTGGVFVLKTGFMYTHNCGINDFWVESSMNLAYRDYEDVTRKRHYDHTDFTDFSEMFDTKEIGYDNYYAYDRSTSVDKFWGSSWGQLQKNYYDPLIAETCFIKYPKRLIYSAPATGWKDKSKLSSKNDNPQDFWRVYLSENFRDFKANVTTIKPINETGAMIFFPTLSPKVFQGSDRLQLSNTKITIGDGGLFSQAFQNVANSDVSHEYGSCESARSVLNTPYGLFFVSQAQGKIFQSSGKGLQPISDMGMKWWFNKYLPSKLLEFFPEIESCPQAVDNALVGAGVSTVYDPNNDIVYFTKKDYIPLSQYQNNDQLEYSPCDGFYLNGSTGNNPLPLIAECPPGYSLQIGADGLDHCYRTYQEAPLLNAIASHSYGLSIHSGNDLILNVPKPNLNYGRDMPIVLDSYGSDGLPTDQTDPSTWHFLNQSWWRNILVSPNDGIVNQLASGGSTSNPQHSYLLWEINTPVARSFYFLVSCIDWYVLDKVNPDLTNENVLDIKGAEINALFAETQAGGIWDGQPAFSYLRTKTSAEVMRSKPWIYKIDVEAGCTKFVGYGDHTPTIPVSQTFMSCALLDVNDVSELENASSYSSIPKAFSSDVDKFHIPGGSLGSTYTWECTAGYSRYTDGTDGGTDACPVCRKMAITNVCACETDTTSGLPGILVGVCPVNETIGASYCQYTAEADIKYTAQKVRINLTDQDYFKEISWTISYDPKAKAWMSFHDWHPELTFNSIKHFLTSRAETTDIPQCPPGYTFDTTTGECCVAYHDEFPADVSVDEFMSDLHTEDSVVSLFTSTLDFAIVIDNSGSTTPTPMPSQLAFAAAFINGMVDGMAGGAYPTQVRIGHGSWDGFHTACPTGPYFEIVQPLTNVPATALGSLTTANYPGDCGTDYDQAVACANGIFTDLTADERIVIFITDATVGSPGNPNNFTNATQCIAVFADNSATGIANCSYAGNLNTMITATGLSAPYNIATCAPGGVGATPRNMYHVGGQVPVGDEGNFQSVADEIIESYVSCLCNGDTVIDTNVNNNDCLPLPNPPPNCISCSCPDGYTLIGSCTDSSQLPICRLMTCDCPSTVFNDDEIVTITGKCDDVVLWYNPNTGYGDPSYVNNDPLTCTYDYELCYPANYEIGFFWKHNTRTDLFNNYYDESFPWEVDIIEQTGQQVTTLRSIEYQMEAYIYENDGRDRFHDLDYNFDEAIIYNSEQVSGQLNLILEPKNNIQLSMMYPIVNANSIDTLFSKEEQKYRFNQFWDVTNDRGEFTGAVNTIFNTEWNGYVRNLNTANINYAKPQQQRKKFRHYYNHILLRKSAAGSTTRKMLLKLENTKLNVSFR